ncbi:hypothetical protein LSAT2_032908 [Lamellibrachia satsuma]|nr:hypothetical protein LSAT2_032908 [Lamellibrachia satsuma]
MNLYNYDTGKQVRRQDHLPRMTPSTPDPEIIHYNSLLAISPARYLQFDSSGGGQATDVILLLNRTEQHVIYKVKTTCPGGYRVSSNSGIIRPKRGAYVEVVLPTEHLAAIDGDTFLIHARPVDITTTSHGSDPALLQRLWDTHKGRGYTEHRLVCVRRREATGVRPREATGVRPREATGVSERGDANDVLRHTKHRQNKPHQHYKDFSVDFALVIRRFLRWQRHVVELDTRRVLQFTVCLLLALLILQHCSE